MKDFVPLGSGNSRFLKTVNNAKTLYPTYDAFLNALVDGTLPIDLNGINSAGVAQMGTPLNKANLLTDSTAAKLGLSTDASVNDALRELSYVANWYVWVKIASVGKCTEEEFGSGVGAFSFWHSDSGINFMYFDEMEIRSDGFVAKNPTGISINTTTVANGTLDVLKGKYVAFYSSSNTGIQVLYHFPADTTMGYYVDSNNYYITSTSGFTKYTNPVVESSVIGYAASADNNAYPQDGEVDGVHYKYVKQIGEAGAKIETGSYTGTGTVGSADNATVITIPETTKLLFIMREKHSSAQGSTTTIIPVWKLSSSYDPIGILSLSLENAVNTSWGNAGNAAIYAKFDNGTFSAYASGEDPQVQFNHAATQYHYLAVY